MVVLVSSFVAEAVRYALVCSVSVTLYEDHVHDLGSERIHSTFNVVAYMSRPVRRQRMVCIHDLAHQWHSWMELRV